MSKQNNMRSLNWRQRGWRSVGWKNSDVTVEAPADSILHWDADIDAFSEQVGGPHTFNHNILSPQYQRNADGSYTDVGAKPAVDVFGGKRWLRSCGAVTNLLPSGAEDISGLAWSKRGTAQVAAFSDGANLITGINTENNDVFIAVLTSVSVPVTPAISIKKVSDSGVLLFLNPAAASSGQWEIDLSLLGDGFEDIHSTHPAVTVVAPHVSTSGGWTGLHFRAKSGGPLSFYLRNPQLTATSYPVPYVPPGVTQPASNATTTNGSWFTLPKYIDKVAGAGVGPCPESVLPPLMVPMVGHDDPTSPNYGTYIYDGVADMCFIPRFYYKVNNALGYSFGTHGANTLTIRGSETFASTAAANIAGFALHRAFIDGGVEHAGFFVDKYKCSKVAKGTGFVAGSVKNWNPLSTASDHNPIAEITSAGANNYAACIDAAKGRDGDNGVKNGASRFAPISVFQRSALALFSLGYGEAATESDYCAWYDATGLTNFPKGCNNDNLGDVNDGSVKYTSDGYLTCGKTGSGVPFEKTTHNGQACGVADLNGPMWEVSLGMTCIATTKSITGATQANPCVLTVPGHGLTTGRIIQVTSVVGMTQLNNVLYTVTVLTPDTISLDGVNSTGFTAYGSAGSIAYGAFYAAKEATRMRDFTSGAASATDHWGAVGVAAMMDEIALPFVAASGGSSMDQKFGNAANQVLSADTSGAGYVLTGIGHPKDANGLSTTGTDLFGKDQVYQHFRDQLCVVSGGHWSNGSNAGVFARYLEGARNRSGNNVGLRCACYPDTANDPTATPPSILGSKVRSVSPLWKALAGDEVKGSPLTLATRIRMGVGSGDFPVVGYPVKMSVNTYSSGLIYNALASDGTSQVGRTSDGSTWLNVFPYITVNRNDVWDLVVQVSSNGLQYRSGRRKVGVDSTITWGSWTNFDGSFNPSTLYRLMLNYSDSYPSWFNKITAWRKQVSDAEILEAMA